MLDFSQILASSIGVYLIVVLMPNVHADRVEKVQCPIMNSISNSAILKYDTVIFSVFQTVG